MRNLGWFVVARAGKSTGKSGPYSSREAAEASGLFSNHAKISYEEHPVNWMIESEREHCAKQRRGTGG